MTTIIRSTAVLGLALALTAGAAAAQQTVPGRDSVRARAHDTRGMRRADRGRGPLLRGITLSADQQQRLRALDDRYGTEGRALREKMRPAAEQARAARQRGDSAAARAAWQGTADQRKQFADLQQRRMKDVRALLTAEQQKQFDANRADMEKRMAERRAGRGGRGGRGGFRGSQG